MDKASGRRPGNSIAVTGTGLEISPDASALLCGERRDISESDLAWDCRPVEFLRIRKTLKFMSKQDRLAVSAAGKAITQADDRPENLETGCGVFMAVGYIPFRLVDAAEFCEAAIENGEFSMRKFSTEGFDRINPLLAFSCLPNMPAHHVSANFDLRGEYFVTYPGTPQFCLALEEAIACIAEGRAQSAIVGGVADQSNFLVQNHYKKSRPNEIVHAADAAAFVFIEPEWRAKQRNAPVLARLDGLDMAYEEEANGIETSDPEIEFGAATLPARLCMAIHNHEKRFVHARMFGRYNVKSQWEIA